MKRILDYLALWGVCSREPNPGRVAHPFVRSRIGAYEGYQLVASGYQRVWAPTTPARQFSTPCSARRPCRQNVAFCNRCGAWATFREQDKHTLSPDLVFNDLVWPRKELVHCRAPDAIQPLPSEPRNGVPNAIRDSHNANRDLNQFRDLHAASVHGALSTCCVQ